MKPPKLATRVVLSIMTTHQLHEAVKLIATGHKTAGNHRVRDLLLGEYERRAGTEAAAALRRNVTVGHPQPARGGPTVSSE